MQPSFEIFLNFFQSCRHGLLHSMPGAFFLSSDFLKGKLPHCIQDEAPPLGWGKPRQRRAEKYPVLHLLFLFGICV